MGTRHLICIWQGNDWKLAQYGQWDGYPDGQGTAIVDFLREADLALFKERVAKSRMVTEEDLRERWVLAGANPESKYVGMDVAKAFSSRWPQLDRDSGAATLKYIMSTEEPEVQPSSLNFAADSLFCEWAYVIDLDAETFEVYEGFQNEPHTDGRFHELWDDDNDRRDKPYYPVKLVAAWPIQAIPSNWIQEATNPLPRLAKAAE